MSIYIASLIRAVMPTLSVRYHAAAITHGLPDEVSTFDAASRRWGHAVACRRRPPSSPPAQPSLRRMRAQHALPSTSFLRALGFTASAVFAWCFLHLTLSLQKNEIKQNVARHMDINAALGRRGC